MNRLLTTTVVVSALCVHSIPRLGAQSLTRSSKRLEKGRTMLLVELQPSSLARAGGSLPYVQLLREPAVAKFFESAAAQDRASWRLWRRLPELAGRVAAFDGGVTCALVIDPEVEGGSQQLHYLISHSKRDELRDFVSTLHSYLPAHKIADRKFTVPDTPVMVRFVTEKPANRYWPRHFASVIGPRHAAFLAGRHYLRQDERDDSAYRERFGRMLARSAGIGSRGRGVGLGKPKLADGERVLGRGAFLFQSTYEALRFKEDVQERVDARMRALGFNGFDGVEAFLIEKDGVCRERIEVHSKNVQSPSFVRAVVPDPEDSLGRVAKALPEDALAALHVGVAPQELEPWFQGMLKLAGRHEVPVFNAIRNVMSAFAKRVEGLPEHDSVTLAVLRPVGTLFPEPVVLVRRRADPQVEPKAEVEAIAKRVAAEIFPEQKDAIQVRARGGEAPHAFFRFPQPEGGMSTAMSKTLLGGGYLTVLRVGDYLALGLNPRTLRKFGKDVARGKVLAQREGFGKRFPETAARALEGWFDWNGVASSVGAVEPMATWLMVGVSDGQMAMRVAIAGEPEEEEEPQKPAYKPDPRDTPPKMSVKVPSFGKLLRGFGEEYFISQKSDFGVVIEHEGCLVLSPIAIGAISAFGTFIGDLQPFMQDLDD